MSVLVAFLAACAPELNWRKVEAEHANGLSGLFPCKPDRVERKVPWPGIPAGLTMRLLSCTAQGRTWALSYATVPDVTQVEPLLQQWPQMTLAKVREASSVPDAVLARDLGPVQVPRMTPSSLAHAWRFEGLRRDGDGQPQPLALTTWHFFHGMTVFQASVSGTADTSGPQTSEDVTLGFFRSFHFPG
jgi:hypothetical protein